MISIDDNESPGGPEGKAADAAETAVGVEGFFGGTAGSSFNPNWRRPSLCKRREDETCERRCEEIGTL
jgi:hypothetical protein